MIRLVKYLCVGAVAASLDICIFAFFASHLSFPWVYVSIASFVLATTLNYFLSIKYVFQSGLRYEKNQEIACVFLVSGLALLVNQIVLYVAIEVFGASLLYSKILATGAVFIFNYLGRARFVF